MVVLVAYGSTGGGTGEIAAWIAEELQAAGFAVQLTPAGEVTGVAGYDAVVLGSALYAFGWHADVRRFVQRFSHVLRGRPVWLFSSGPLDSSADAGALEPVPHAASALRDLTARAHVTFGGRMTTDAHGWLGHVAQQLAREGHVGDFRNPVRVRAWARGVAGEIAAARRMPEQI
ncbi:flavodoxin domain-containing protein [Paractinoplanes durhamensis]|uniref:Flavodoxin n=1 Tax=Paractinoplanes durhamensis TaxID=113563 RepID=A0ABQ3YRV5_9ACTN|nr:flavodoxin domain-containing protein [Actinoplanes durhamensis]GIE00262.1 flavodoxin [Actinoplanes durhamensis]